MGNHEIFSLTNKKNKINQLIHNAYLIKPLLESLVERYIAKTDKIKKNKSRFFHHVRNSSPYPEERPCNANNKGVKMQCRRQSPLAIAPTVSGLFSLKLIIEFFYVN